MAVLDHGHLRAIGRPEDLAAELWDGIPADIDLGGPATLATMSIVQTVDGVLRCEERASGMTIAVRDRNTMARVLARLAGGDVSVYGATMRHASMEDVYFALEDPSMLRTAP